MTARTEFRVQPTSNLRLRERLRNPPQPPFEKGGSET